MEEQGTQQAVWNFDGAQLYNLFQLKTKFIEYLLVWDLENSYWILRFMRMELDSKLKRHSKFKIDGEKEDTNTKTEKDEMDEKMTAVDTVHSDYNKKTSHSQMETAIFYLTLEDFYMHLCYTMKKHGLYFREGDDPRLAVLRR